MINCFYLILFLSTFFLVGCVGMIVREAEEQEMEDARKRMEECRKTPESCDSIIIPDEGDE